MLQIERKEKNHITLRDEVLSSSLDFARANKILMNDKFIERVRGTVTRRRRMRKNGARAVGR